MLPIPDEKQTENVSRVLAVIQKYFIYLVIIGSWVVAGFLYQEVKHQRDLRQQDLQQVLEFFRDGYIKSQNDVKKDYRERNDYRP